MYLLYFALWVIFNGAFTLEICIFGLVIAAVIFWFSCKFLDYSIESEKKVFRKLFQGIRYVFTLIKEIVKANLTVIPMILSEQEELEPVIVRFRTDVKSTAGRAFLANAITLTPGTITATLEGDEYHVHCLDASLAEGMEDSVFADLLKEIEK